MNRHAWSVLGTLVIAAGTLGAVGTGPASAAPDRSGSAVRPATAAAAADTGATWAVIVDTDERMVLNGVDIHAVLASSPELSLLVPHDTASTPRIGSFACR